MFPNRKITFPLDLSDGYTFLLIWFCPRKPHLHHCISNISILTLQNPVFMVTESNTKLSLMEVLSKWDLSEARTLDMAQFLSVINEVL